MFRRFLPLLGALVFAIYCNAQQLLSPSFTFSHNKTAYVTLNDGTELKGTLKDIDRKKGLIKFVNLEDGTGKKHKLKPETIKYMYLPPSGVDKLSKAASFLTDMQKWNNEKMDQDLLNQGYVYFENTKVKIKKKEFTLLMQLLNPSFSRVVKVYHDPLAKSTASIGAGPVTLAGGDAKSYYIKIGEDAAFLVEKKNYKKEFVPLWKSCANVKEKYPEVKWTQLADHIITYTECK
ncbi:MAG: hypothetical protein QM786_11115 [Breznakibacter sp.]